MHDFHIHITMCLRVLRDALVSQVEYFRLRRSRATASERAMIRANFHIQYGIIVILILTGRRSACYSAISAYAYKQ